MHTRSRSLDIDALRSHGVGEGEYVALVFSGHKDVLGEAIGMPTWSTPRKFAFPDSRLEPEEDLARCEPRVLPAWTGPVVPVPGVCFVLSDASHPLRRALADAGAMEHEDVLTLDTLSAEHLRVHRVRRWLAGVGNRPVALLGFGDQGSKLLDTLESLGVPARSVLVVDSDARRRALAASRGTQTSDAADERLGGCAIISSPLRRPRAFDGACSAARHGGRPVLDMSASMSGHSEFACGGAMSLTPGAHRTVNVQGSRVALRPGAPALTLRVIREDLRSIGAARVPHLHGVQRLDLAPAHPDVGSAAEWFDLGSAWTADRLGVHWSGFTRGFAGVDGQSNQHDAAIGVFAARAALMDAHPDAVRAILPSDRRASMGATALESHLMAAATGRTVAPPYLTPIELVTLAVYARACGSDAPIIEIGSALGGSAVLMALATQRGDAPSDGPSLFSIDPDRQSRSAMRLALEHAGVGSRVRMLERTSDDAAMEMGHAAASMGGAGLIFVDGLHTFEQCTRDAARYAPMVRPGGVMIFHDFDPRFAGVMRAVLEGPMRSPSLRLERIMDTIAVFRRIARDHR